MRNGREAPAPVFVGFDLFFIVFDRVQRFEEVPDLAEQAFPTRRVSLIQGVLARIGVGARVVPTSGSTVRNCAVAGS
jgi:hypothetical protein